MRLSRLNYDKVHRCPGWSGGGWRGGPDPARCPGGSFAAFMYERSHWRQRFTRCRQCGLVCLPYVTRWADLSWLHWYFGERRRIYGRRL